MNKRLRHPRFLHFSPRPTHQRHRGGWWGSRALFLLLAGCWLLLLPPSTRHAAAQNQEQDPSSPFQLDVEVGFDNAYRQNRWVPITVMVSNNGPDVQGLIEWSFPGLGSHPVQREIDLPRGSHKRLHLAAFASGFLRVGQVRLLAGNSQLASKEIRFEPIEQDQFVVGVVSSDRTLLNSLAAMQLAGTAGTTVLHFDLETLPEQAPLLNTLDALFLHDLPTRTLSTEQLVALDMWVRLGGELVVSGGASADQAVPGVAHLLPATVRDLVRDVDLTPLLTLAGTATTLPPRATASRVTLIPEATSPDGSNLLAVHNHGSGRVIFSAFDLRALRAWSSEATLWEDMLRNEPRFSPTSSSLRLRDVLQFPALHLPSFTVLLAYVLGYILLVGPLNFLLLRLLRRAELAWVTIPVLVVLFIVGTYGTNLLVRGTRPEVLQLAVVQGFEDSDHAFATSYLGLFSPYRQNYTISLAPDSLVSQQRLNNPFDRGAPVVWNDSATDVRDLLVDVASLNTLLVERSVEPGVKLRSSLEQQNSGTVAGTIENLGNEPLTDALLIYGDSATRVGTIAPGETITMHLRPDQHNFPDGVNASTEGLFDRQLVLSMFFGGPPRWIAVAPPLSGGLPTTAGTYLLAWSEHPLIAAEVNNAPVQQQGLTLYVIRLNSLPSET